jgi:hypothetical protein
MKIRHQHFVLCALVLVASVASVAAQDGEAGMSSTCTRRARCSTAVSKTDDTPGV